MIKKCVGRAGSAACGPWLTHASLVPLAALLALSACSGSGGGRMATTPRPAPPPAATPAPSPTPAPAPASSFDTAEYRRSSGPQQHGAIAAWDAGRSGAGQTIAIVDTGIDTANPEFAGRILAASRDVTNAGRTIQGESDHGTNVALVAAAARNGGGVMGIAFNASLLVLRADRQGSCAAADPGTTEAGCSFLDRDLARGVDAAVASGARVINLSLGGADGIGPELRDAVTRAAGAGVVIVVAAGNGGDGSKAGVDPGQPNAFASAIRAAGGANVIIVGSVDAANQLSAFSQRAGAQATWYLGARGERVCCVYENGQIFVGQDANGSYNLLFSGTSFATPQVAGAVALLAQAFPNLTGPQIVRILLDSARDAGAPGIDPVYGAGVLDIAAAMQPRGAMTLAGGTTAVQIGADSVIGSAAMGDAFAGAGPVQGVALDAYARAYGVDFATGLQGAAPRRRLHAALGGGARVSAGATGGAMLAVTVADAGSAARTDWVRQLQLTPEQAQGAEVLAARVAARIAPGAEIALALREGAGGLVAQLQGSRRPAFLIAGAADGDSGFARGSTAAVALRRRFGALGLTASAESGEAWLGNWRRAAEVLPGQPHERRAARSFALAADRRFGPADVVLGASWLAEDTTMLGAFLAPAFGARGSDTLFLDASAGIDMGGSWRLGGAWRQGWTRARIAGLVAPGSAFASAGWNVDLTKANAFAPGDSLGLRLSQPLRVSRGGVGLTLPVAYDYATLAATYGTRFIALAPTGRELDAELAWHGLLWGGEAGASLYYRTDPGHYAAMPDDRGVAITWRRRF